MRVAVTGGKGGVGKSTVAYNLGRALSAVVVDADLGMADLPTARGPDLHDVLAGRADPVEAVREDGPVALLPCGRTLRGARAADPRRLVETVEAVESVYGRVVVDCPAGLGSDVGLALLAAESCVVVTTPSSVALADAIRARVLARELDAGLAGVALNRVGADPPVSRVERLFGAPVTTIPASETVATATTTGVPVASLSTECAEPFEELATAVYSSRRS
ncbi:chromosome partitioning protein ParA [Halomarina ordinaria]|uniref:Chromosome partitioning protein ParA n=1 Tax=Halomarina ordinaria TaxID=3033939 RepID=A0ABD5UD40_9EURY|nr:chromosome partitioning protein ParA [Halomarina sp. PSRA2]